VLIGFQEHVLAEIHGIFAIRDQPQQIIKDALFPPGHQEVIGLDVPAPRFGDQVAIFDLAKDQLSSSVDKDAHGWKKVGLSHDTAPATAVLQIHRFFTPELAQSAGVKQNSDTMF
jgi:hypothetical protein